MEYKYENCKNMKERKVQMINREIMKGKRVGKDKGKTESTEKVE